VSRGRRDLFTVGLTGGIGAGKSTALALFGALGALTFSADEVVHGLYREETCKKALLQEFGPAVLTTTGEVDRRRLAQLVRGRPDRLRWLEGLTHPLVHERLERFIASAPSGSVVVCEIPLLFEAGYGGMFDLIVTIEASPSVRRQRSVHGFGLDQFEEFEGLQATAERRRAGSDVVFVNDGSRAELEKFVKEVYALAQKQLAERAAPREGDVL